MKKVKFNLLKIILVLSIMLFTSNLFAQIDISGIVTDEANDPLPGVTVVEKGTQKGTVTDQKGTYSISVKSRDAVLVFSFIGFEDKEIVVESQRKIDIQLSEKAELLDEVVVIGYGTSQRKDLTGAVSSISDRLIKKTFATNVSSSIQGRLTGVTVETDNGEPGSSVSVLIRGVSSFTNVAPLVVVDGIVGGSLNDINPNDIASIDILKDASSAAIYGASGGNGVILITTKRGGSDNKIHVELSIKTGVNWSKNLDVLYANEYAQFISERIFIQSNGTAPPPHWTSTAERTGKGTDWQGEIFSPGIVQDYSASVYGNRNDVSFRLGVGKIGEKGSLKGVSSDKTTFSGRVDINKEKWKAGMDFNVLSQDRTTNLWGGGGHTKGSKQGVFSIAMYNPLFTVDGTLPGSTEKWWDALSGDEYNFYVVPPSFFIDNFKGSSNYSRLDTRSYLELTPIKDLSVRAQLLMGFDDYSGTNFAPSYIFGEGLGMMRYDINQVWENMNKSNYWNADLFATYTKSLNKNNFKLMAGINGSFNEGMSRNMTGTQTPSNNLQVVTAASEGLTVTGGLYETAKAAYFGRLNYDFATKYLVQFTYRRDGTSMFGPGYKWGGFPSASIGWRVSEESFFTPLKSIINYMKIRGGVGRLGNSEIGNYRYSNYVIPGLHYIIGRDQRKWVGTNVKNFASPDVHWETSNQYDAGVDLAFLNGMFTLEYNYFDKYSEELLVEMPVPGESGGNTGQDGRVYRNPYMNFGEIRNYGHEASLVFNKRIGEFQFDISFNATFIKNEVLKMGYEGQKIFGGGIGGTSEFQTSVIMAGQTVASFYLIPTDGLFNNQDEIDNYTAIDPNTGVLNIIQPEARPGDVKYKDTDGDGRITTSDRIIMGNAFPDFSGGLGFNASYKNFDFSLFFNAVQGVDIMNGTLARMTPGPGTGYGNALREYWENHWTPENPERDDAKWPINLNSTNNNNERPSDRYMDDGSYIRLRNIQIGYSLPKVVLSKIQIEKARIYISGQNLITWTDYIGYDPEVGGGHLFGRGIDAGGTPLSRTFYGGIEITF